jgi:hypothetical protein
VKEDLFVLAPNMSTIFQEEKRIGKCFTAGLAPKALRQIGKAL